MTFANPCINPDYVYIEAPTLVDYDYFIYAAAEVLDAHEPFELVTVPVEHSLCGGLTFVAKFDGNPVTGAVLTYDESARQFTLQSDDENLFKVVRTYSVEAELTLYPAASYPTAATARAIADIFFDNPCEDPAELLATA